MMPASYALLREAIRVRPVELQACITTIAGADACSSFSIELDTHALSTLTIEGAQRVYVSPDQPVTLKVAAYPYRTPTGGISTSGGCEPVPQANVQRITYTWSRESGPASLDAAGLQYSAKDLTIPAGLFLFVCLFEKLHTIIRIFFRRCVATRRDVQAEGCCVHLCRWSHWHAATARRSEWRRQHLSVRHADRQPRRRCHGSH